MAQAIIYSLVCRLEWNRDMLSVSKLFSFYSWLRVVPFNILYSLGYSKIDSRVLRWIENTGLNLEYIIGKYVVLNSIAFILTWLTLRYVSVKFKKKVVITTKKSTVLTIMIIGFYGLFMFVVTNGGVLNIVLNLANRVELQSGSIFIKLRPLIGLGFLLLYHGRKRVQNRGVVYWILLISVIFSYIITGGRKEVLLFLLYIGLFEYKFNGRNLLVISTKNTILVIVCAAFILVMPVLRSSDGVNNLRKIEISEMVQESASVFTYLNYSYIEMFIYTKFTSDFFWNGRSFYSLYSMFNRSLKAEERPPLDEGVYLTSMMRCNCELKPPIARSKLYATSYPLENVGTMYANGLMPGLILGSLLLGYFFKFIETIFTSRKDSGLGLYIYLWIVMEFNFSVLRISSLIIFFSIMSLVLAINYVEKVFR